MAFLLHSACRISALWAQLRQGRYLGSLSRSHGLGLRYKKTGLERDQRSLRVLWWLPPRRRNVELRGQCVLREFKLNVCFSRIFTQFYCREVCPSCCRTSSHETSASTSCGLARHFYIIEIPHVHD